MTPEEELRAIDQRLSAMDELSQIDAQLAQMDQQPQEAAQPEKPGFSWPRFIGENLAQGTFSLADLPQLFSEATLGAGREMLPTEELQKKHGFKKREQGPSPFENMPLASETLHKGAKGAGLDLRSMGEGETPLQRIVGRGAQVAGASILPGGGLRGAATGMGLGALQGAGSQSLKEVGVPDAAAEIASLLGTAAVPGMIKGTRGVISGKNVPLSSEETKVAKMVKGMMGEEQTAQTIANLEKPPAYSAIAYQPTTAEIANSPALSQLHRNRYGMPESGLASHAGAQNEAIHAAIEPHTLNAIKSHELKEGVTSELAKREGLRRKETKPLYKQVAKHEEGVNPTHLKRYLKETTVRGKPAQDLNAIKRDIKPAGKLTPNDRAYKEFYEKASPEQQKHLEKPKNAYPKGKELSAAYSAINARIEKLNPAEKQRKLILSRAKNSLEKDLEAIPAHKEATAKYKELSQPVNEILKHPKIKKIPKSTSNDIFAELFDKSSKDNLQSLKKVLGNNKEEWEGVRQASIKHLKDSVTNAQAEGRSHVLSYPKLNNFMKKHEGALKEILTDDQIKVVNELKSALHGQNIAKTLGVEPGSPTAARTAINEALKQHAGFRASEALTKIPFVPKILKNPLQFFMNRWASYNKEKTLEMLDKMLKEPEFAHKILTHEFKSQSEFNKYMKQLAPAVVATHKGEDNE